MKTITAGGKEYDLYSTTGKVEETGKNMETKVSGGGGGGGMYRGYGGTAPVTIRSTTTIHDQIFLTDAAGAEHSFQLQDFNVACRTGNILTVLWAIKKGDKTGPYIAVYNHTTGNSFFDTASLNKIFRRPVLYMLGAIVLCLILGNFISLFYFGIIVVPILWFVEGSMGAKKFKAETDFKEYNLAI